ncbi:hypothetical protein GRS96_06300 [Rathayibacter sp. VKM Ac-2803]|uniref:hypothetical protein n=1 Tax=unclassified Rathayibacter TaxID=2609250 RepID=UPI0013599406|nr:MULTISPECIES: hypothetical protein [unclassified Rathayibacter]MWV48888.1 hypothetical protein [Rathayibacter sp. VKM Ac-2803]MWV58623.1 hypothetical protein [Rathayibacter sp. VKM Ac-2754]
MRRGTGWWPALVAYTALLWVVTLAVPAVAVTLPNEWSYSPENVPPLAILANSLYTLGPALFEATLAMTAGTVAFGVFRAHRATADEPVREAPSDDDATSGWARIVG